jgi:hypothetical protein
MEISEKVNVSVSKEESAVIESIMDSIIEIYGPDVSCADIGRFFDAIYDLPIDCTEEDPFYEIIGEKDTYFSRD